MSTSATVPMIAPTGEIGDVPLDRAHEAVLHGGTLAVDMLSPDGQAGVIPFDKVHDAIRAGGTLAPAQVQKPQGDMEEMGETEEDEPMVDRAVNIAKGAGSEAAGIAEGAVTQVFPGQHQLVQSIKNAPGIYKAYENARKGGKGVWDSLSAANDQAKKYDDAQSLIKQRTQEFLDHPDHATGRLITDAIALLAGKFTGKATGEFSDEFGAAVDSDNAVNEIAHPTDAELGATGNSQPAPAGPKPSNMGPGGGPRQEVIGGAKYPAGRNIGTSPGMQTPGGAVVASRGPKALLTGETAPTEADEAESQISPEEWEAGHDLETNVENTRRPEVAKGQKAAAEKAFLDHLGVTKEDIAAAKGKQAQAYQKFLLKAAQKGKEFGPKGGVTPELQEGARAAGRSAYLKHLGIDEGLLEEAKSRGRQGAMEHYKKSLQDLKRRPGTQKQPTD